MIQDGTPDYIYPETVSIIANGVSKMLNWETKLSAFGGFTTVADPAIIRGMEMKVTTGHPQMLYRQHESRYRRLGKRMRSKAVLWAIYFFRTDPEEVVLSQTEGDMDALREDWIVLREHFAVAKLMRA